MTQFFLEKIILHLLLVNDIKYELKVHYAFCSNNKRSVEKTVNKSFKFFHLVVFFFILKSNGEAGNTKGSLTLET